MPASRDGSDGTRTRDLRRAKLCGHGLGGSIRAQRRRPHRLPRGGRRALRRRARPGHHVARRARVGGAVPPCTLRAHCVLRTADPFRQAWHRDVRRGGCRCSTRGSNGRRARRHGRGWFRTRLNLRHVRWCADEHPLCGHLPGSDVGAHPGRGDRALELGARLPVGHARDGRTRGARGNRCTPERSGATRGCCATRITECDRGRKSRPRELLAARRKPWGTPRAHEVGHVNRRP
jgi:hypothetical protein